MLLRQSLSTFRKAAQIPADFNDTKTLGMMQMENLSTIYQGLSGFSITCPEWEHGIKGTPTG